MSLNLNQFLSNLLQFLKIYFLDFNVHFLCSTIQVMKDIVSNTDEYPEKFRDFTSQILQEVKT